MPVPPTSPSSSASASPELLSQVEDMLRELRNTRATMLEQIDAQILKTTSLLNSLHGQGGTANGAQPPAKPSFTQPVMQAPPKLHGVVFNSQEQASIDPALEQATLAELNAALAQAFTEIASRGGMLGR